jgi:polysaccharide chain length determinant protein (PEP-CTERM system associated)
MQLWYLVVRKAFAAAWRRRWLAVATAWLVCLLGWAAVFLIPQTYESQARLYVDTDAVLTPLLTGLAIDTTTASQLEIMQKTLLSRPNLDKLINSTSLNLNATTPAARQFLIAELGQQTKLGSEAKNLFTVTYRNTDPQLAHDVVAGLINIFLDVATSSNRADMVNARKFLQEQIASYEKQLRAAERRRADFREKYLDILQLESGGSRLDNARVAVRDLKAQSNDAVSKRDALKQEVSTTPQALDFGGRSVTGAPISQNDQLSVAQAKLVELRTRLTDENPDVVAVKRLVEALAAGNKGPTAAGGPRNGVPNPLYEQLKLRLIEAEATVFSVNSRLDTARGELARMEGLSRAAPQVQAEYENLDRDYNILRKNYEELLARRETSNITSAADSGADKVRLRVVDPPQVSKIPVAPNRMMLLSLVLIGGLGAPVALSVVLSQTDRSVSDIGHLRNLGFPVLGGISRVGGGEEQRRGYGPQLVIAAMVLLLLVVYGGLATRVNNIHWFV